MRHLFKLTRWAFLALPMLHWPTAARAQNVGIGTTTPTQKLEVAGNVLVNRNYDLLLSDAFHGLGYYGATKPWNGATPDGPVLYGFSGGILGTNQFGTRNAVLSWVAAGNVGIGTTAPAYPLDVATSGNYQLGPGSFSVLAPGRVGGGFPGNCSVSIRAAGNVVAAEFDAVSDRRLKLIAGRSDGRADLSLLTQLRITDYTMRDWRRFGDHSYKKIIAQEVEAVFPQAVSRQSGFLPDVYASASIRSLPGDSLLLLVLPSGLATAAGPGQRLKLITARGEMVATVAAPAAAGTRVLMVLNTGTLRSQAEAFVYGLEHPDVRAVDYDALAMLHISATQELVRQVEVLRQQNATLQRAAGEDHASLLTLQAQVARLLGTDTQAHK